MSQVLPPPPALSVPLGPLAVAWLPATAALDERTLAAGLHPDEEAAAAAMKSAPRRAEFRKARWLVRALTGEPAPLQRSDAGVITWPRGMVGSLTHKDGAVGVTLAPRAQWRGVGIDAEDEARMQLAFEPRLCSPEESALLDRLTGGDPDDRRVHLAALFSFKEAIFKACYPLGGVMFHFHDARVKVLQQGAVTAELLKDVSPFTPAGKTITGTWLRHAEDGRRYALTSALVPA